MAGASIHIKVDPQDLKRQSQDVQTVIQTIKKDFDTIRRIVRSANYWQGDASKKHKKLFEDNEQDINEILKRLNEHPVDLRKMAGVYSEAEEASIELANKLPDSVIS